MDLSAHQQQQVLPDNSLPLGFRFRPTDEELVNHYLKRKINGRIDSKAAAVIPVVDVCKSEPWDLPDKSAIQSDDLEWFFFAPRDRKYSSGQRANRATQAGYWKATGKDRLIKSKPGGGGGGGKGGSQTLIGMKKTLVFHSGRAPRGERTGWIMHEYRTVEPEFESGEKGGFVLCRLFKKTEERTSSPTTDEIEKNGTPTASGSDTVGSMPHEQDDSEEVRKLPNEKSPGSHSKEHPPPEPPQQGGSQNNGNMVPNATDHESKTILGEVPHATTDESLTVAGESSDPVMHALVQFCNTEQEPLECDMFPDILSPMLPYTDYPLADDYGPGFDNTLLGVENAEVDSMTEFLCTIVGNQEEYSSEVSSAQTDPFTNTLRPVVHKQVPQDYSPMAYVSGKESPESSDLNNEAIFPQVFKDADWDCGPFFSSKASVQMEHSNGSIYESPDVNCRGVVVPLVDTMDCLYNFEGFSNHEILSDMAMTNLPAESYAPPMWQLPISGMVESSNKENAYENAFGSPATGITLKYRQTRNLPENAVLKQGGAIRRIRLQSCIHVGPGSSTMSESGSSNQADSQVEVSSIEDGMSAQSTVGGEKLLGSPLKDRAYRCYDEGEESSKATNSRSSKNSLDDEPKVIFKPKNDDPKICSFRESQRDVQ